MILADDVTDANGRLLLSRGQVIASNHMTLFKMRGVADVSVRHCDGSTGEVDRPPDPIVMRQVAEGLKPAFSDNDLTHPVVAEIFRQAVIHRSRSAGRVEPLESFAREVEARRNVSESVDLRKKIRMRDIKLPEIPTIVFKLNDIIADPFSSADDVGRLVIFKYLSAQAVCLLSGRSAGTGSLYEGEKALLGFRHTDIARALKEFGDADTVRIVVRELTENVKKQLCTIRESIAQKDRERIRKETHAIKGGAATLEAVALTGAAARLEKLASRRHQRYRQA